MFKFSNYTIVIPLSSHSIFMLFNTLSEKIMLIQDENKKIVGREIWDDRNLNKEEKEIFIHLRNLGFLVQVEVDEAQVARRNLLARRFDTEVMEVNILPTYWCNLKCSYCYQRKYTRNITMNETIFNQTLNWINKNLQEFKSKELNITFHGGEALGRINLLEVFCERLIDITDRHCVKLNLNLTTNGTLLFPNNVKKLTNWGMNNIKITVDGDEKIHNFRRPFLNGKGSYKRIISNLIEQCGKLNIVLRCNFDRDNVEKIPKVLDYLAKEEINKHLTYVEFQPVLKKKDFSSAKEKVCSSSLFNKHTKSQIIWLTKKALERDFKINTEFIGGRCPAFFKSSFLVDPIGDIYKCPAFAVDKTNVLGNVRLPGLSGLADKYLRDRSWDKCFQCEFVAMCCGGCRFAAQERYGSFLDRRICEKSYYKEVSLKILELVYNKKISEMSFNNN